MSHKLVLSACLSILMMAGFVIVSPAYADGSDTMANTADDCEFSHDGNDTNPGLIPVSARYLLASL